MPESEVCLRTWLWSGLVQFIFVLKDCPLIIESKGDICSPESAGSTHRNCKGCSVLEQQEENVSALTWGSEDAGANNPQ